MDEGVIKFQLVFEETVPLPDDVLADLIEGHRRLHAAGLVGRDPQRYGGVPYGNLSKRFRQDSFIISGSGTADIRDPGAAHYSLVTRCDLQHNTVHARGPVAPSSETLTHGMIYRQLPDVMAVAHVHSGSIWSQAERLGLPVTATSAAYGTPAMANEVSRLIESGVLQEQPVFVMGGHRDGVVSFADCMASAVELLIDLKTASEKTGSRQAG